MSDFIEQSQSKQTNKLNTKENKIRFRKNLKNLKVEDRELVLKLEMLKEDIRCVTDSFNYAIDKTLIDSAIYEMNSLNMQYSYYIRLCKEKGIVAEGF